jgi:hypothetical protein
MSNPLQSLHSEGTGGCRPGSHPPASTSAASSRSFVGSFSRSPLGHGDRSDHRARRVAVFGVRQRKVALRA